MNLAWVQALQGPLLILVIGGLLFIEETGVPLPFAPGDLLLTIGGIAIAAGRIGAVAFIAVAMAAIVGGAFTGREIFALVGWERLLKVARPLHIEGALERASGMLQRNGWRAVFTARLIPGLRVHTTEVAGVSRLPRPTFLAGLVPAAAVYVAAFVGLGAAFGRPVIDIIHRTESQLGLLVVGLLVLIVLVLALRAPARRLAGALAASDWTGALVVRVDSSGLILIPACIGLNFGGHAAATSLGLPIFGDSLGTILCGVLAGPWVGGSVGLITNLVSSNTIDPIAAPYAAVSFALGFAAGLAREQGWLNRWSGWLLFWPVAFLIAALISTPLNLVISGGRSGVPLGDAIFSRLAGRMPVPLASFLAEAAIDLPDKFLAVATAMLIRFGLPQPSAAANPLELDLTRAFSFVFRSPRWVARTAIASACLLTSWLVVPFLLFVGYTVAVARNAEAGVAELPAWDRLGVKLSDGFLMAAIFLIWNIPSVLISLPADVASPTDPLLSGLFDVLVVVAGLWGLCVLVLQPAIWAQYLGGGFGAAFDLRAIGARVRDHTGLTVVVGALGIVLPTVGLIGLVGLLIGVLPTIAYMAFVGASLFGAYARMTATPPRRAGRPLELERLPAGG